MPSEDLRVSLQSDGEGFRVRADLGAQSATEPFSLVVDSTWDWKNLETGGPENARGAGAALFEALIYGKVRDLYHQSRGQAGKGEQRIRLYFDPRDESVRPLLALPWELLLDPTADSGRQLALSTRQLLVRELSSNESVRTPAPGELKRVLIATATPRHTPPLDLRRERKVIENELGRKSLKPEVLDHASVSQLSQAIPWSTPQIVHFMGHGLFEEVTGEGTLFFETSHREIDPLGASSFVALFADTPPPRLVILSACFSATSGDSARFGPFSSVAAALVAAGMPAVLAMQTKIQDRSAIDFSQRLYQCLCSGLSVELAVRAARNALCVQQRGTIDWAVPVLYLRESRELPPSLPSRAPTTPSPSNKERVQIFIDGNYGLVGDPTIENLIQNFGGKK